MVYIFYLQDQKLKTLTSGQSTRELVYNLVRDNNLAMAHVVSTLDIDTEKHHTINVNNRDYYIFNPTAY